MLARMSHNLPTKPQDSTSTPQPEKTDPQMGKLARAIGSNVQDIRGNAKWELVKWVYNNPSKVLVWLYAGWATMNAAIASLTRNMGGELIAWVILGVLALLSVLPVLLLTVILSGKRKDGATRNTKMAGDNDTLQMSHCTVWLR